jgi:hypothetical protein
LIYLNDDCETTMKHKYFLPFKYSTTESDFKEITNLAKELGSYFPEKEKPFVVKYNKNIQEITGKYSAIGNPFWQALKFDKDIYDLNGVVKNNLHVNISIHNQTCSNITIYEILCSNSDVKVPDIKMIKAKSNLILEITYLPVNSGELNIPISIITNIGNYYVTLKAKVTQ